MLAILGQVQCSDYHFEIIEDGDRLLLQAKYTEPDAYSGEPGIQKTRKWFLSKHMCKSEFVQTCFKAVITSYEHRARESFLYRGKRVFGPHYDVDALWEIVNQTDTRK